MIKQYSDVSNLNLFIHSFTNLYTYELCHNHASNVMDSNNVILGAYETSLLFLFVFVRIFTDILIDM